MDDFKHYTVMLNKAVDALECTNGKIYVDCTLGGGGHSELILKRIQPEGKLISFDIDDEAINHSKERLKNYKNLTILKSSYTNIKDELNKLGINKITGGVILDLGASYHQLTKQERGFSFSKDSPLDMRFDMTADFSAYDVVNNYSEADLVKIFSEYGEEHFSKRIAKKIVEIRRQKSIKTTTELSNIIISATPKIKSNIHPATRVFQAVRIEVNGELDNIKNVCKNITDDELRFTMLKTSISRMKLEKYRRQNNWHECPNCGILCSPKEKICDSCKRLEEEIFRKKIIKILKILPMDSINFIIQSFAEINVIMPIISEDTIAPSIP